jgi:NAD-dependent dihydropyrimidine dehydrogenase PreA subunit
VKTDQCDSCGLCVDSCPGDILHLVDGRLEVRYPDECSNCGICQLECPQQAIEIEFDWKMLQPPIQVIRRDGEPRA